MTTELAMEMHNIEAGRITPGEIECLRNLVNYLSEDERKDFESRSSSRAIIAEPARLARSTATVPWRLPPSGRIPSWAGA